MNAFGPPLATHGPKKIVVVIFALLAATALWLAWLALRQGEQDAAEKFEVAICFTIAVAFALFAFGMSRRRVTLYSEGLSYSSLFGENQVRWDSLTHFYYQATKQSVNFIPVGTYYWFRLVDAEGQKVRFGSGLARTASLANKLLELTQVPLLKRIANQFDSGADVSFGPISLNRQSGISMRKLWGRVERIPWNEVHSFDIRRGHFYIWRVGKKRANGPAIAKVPNAFALLGLLNIIFKSPGP